MNGTGRGRKNLFFLFEKTSSDFAEISFVACYFDGERNVFQTFIDNVEVD